MTSSFISRTTRNLIKEFDFLNKLEREDDMGKSYQSLFFSATLPCNIGKNRYYDVLPLEHTRVKLSTANGADYINANFIDGEIPNSSRYYISCQAPLLSTRADFWRMIYEQKCTLIVMLTRLYEKNCEKANVYWPEGEGETVQYGGIAVNLKSISFMQDITIRTFRIHVDTPNGIVSRDVVHLHYTEWPDFGVPRSTKLLRQLIDLVDSYADRGKGPIVAHCSAGIGRTGTFIGLAICLEKLKLGLPVNVMQTVRQMRKQRKGMVQTKEQYMFIYAALTDALREQYPHARNLLQTTAWPSTTPSKRTTPSKKTEKDSMVVVTTESPNSLLVLLTSKCNPPTTSDNFSHSLESLSRNALSPLATQVSL
jgi:protein tyrosine phosphatase